MRKALVSIIIILFLIISAKAQDSCNCIVNLDSMISKVSNNYAGYKDKVNAHTQASYQQLVDSLRQEALTKNNMHDCFPLLEKYRLYYYDKHLQLSLKEAQQQSATPGIPVNPPPAQTKWTQKTLHQQLQNNYGHANPIEGIWTTEGYEIGIVFNYKHKTYDAIVLSSTNKNWKEGMLKFIIKATPTHGLYKTEYYRGDFVKDSVHLNVYKNIIEMENYGLWKKIYPVTTDTITQQAYLKEHSAFNAFQFRYLDKNTVYIALKSCDLFFKPILDSVLLANKERLKTIPRWIVDFRGNEGGVTDVFLNLLPYLYTKPMIEKGSSRWMTPDNTNELNKFVTDNKSLLDTNTYNQVARWLDFAKTNPNGWYRDQGDTVKFDSVYRYPERVAILSDKNNASSGETFLILAHGLSDKVTIMGENSAGYLDYGDLQPSILPCNKLALYIPSRRANYLNEGISYDRTGYPPDVYIPANKKDWIEFVYAYWKAHPGSGKK